VNCRVAKYVAGCHFQEHLEKLQALNLPAYICDFCYKISSQELFFFCDSRADHVFNEILILFQYSCNTSGVFSFQELVFLTFFLSLRKFSWYICLLIYWWRELLDNGMIVGGGLIVKYIIEMLNIFLKTGNQGGLYAGTKRNDGCPTPNCRRICSACHGRSEAHPRARVLSRRSRPLLPGKFCIFPEADIKIVSLVDIKIYIIDLRHSAWLCTFRDHGMTPTEVSTVLGNRSRFATGAIPQKPIFEEYSSSLQVTR